MAQTNPDELTLADLFQIFWSHKWFILTTTLLGGILAFGYAKSSQSVYQVDALLQIETKDNKNVTNALGAMADLFQTSNPAESEIEIIKSRLVLGQAAQNLGMDIFVSPLRWGRKERLLGQPKPILVVDRLEVPTTLVGRPLVFDVLPNQTFVAFDQSNTEILRGQVGVGVDSSTNPSHVGVFVRSFKMDLGQQFLVMKRSVLDATQELLGNLQVTEVGKKTGVIRLTYQGFDPVEAARVLNEIANCYVRQNVERKSAEAQKTLEFLQSQLPELKKQLEASEERLNQYRSAKGSIDLSQEARLALEQQVQVKQSLFDSQQKRKEQLQLFESNHPSITTLDSVIANLSAKLSRQESQVKSLPLQQQEVVRLMRDVQVNTDLYTGLLNNTQQLRVVKAGEIGNVRVVDFAVPSELPVGPNKRNILLIGLLAGGLIGIGIHLFLKLVVTGIRDAARIENEFELPVLAQIPHSSSQRKIRKDTQKQRPGIHVLAHQSPDDIAVESFRSLRTALDFSLAESSERVIVMTGPKEGVGKSFVSQNLAVVLAQTGSSVLLVDGDLRRGNLHSAFGVPRANGLSEILTGKMNLASCLFTPLANLPLSILTTGALPQNPSELLHSSLTSQLIHEWAHQYDFVILDAPPVLAVTDAALLGQSAAATLVVFKSGVHPAGEIDHTLARLRQSGVNAKGAILNNVPMNENRYGYSYAYSRRREPDTK